MPILTSLPPYPSAEQVMQLTRVLCLDAGISITGDLLADTAPGVAITAASQVGFVVTITTSQAHGLNFGQVVNILNVGVAGYNGLQTVQTVPALNMFTYVLSVAGLAASSGGSASLDPSQGFILLQSAYEYVQAKLASQGFDTPRKEITLANITPMPAAVRDVNTRAFINYVLYFDGQNNLTPAFNGTPVLPSDLISPMFLQERIHGIQNAPFYPMFDARDGLPLAPQQGYMRNWDWVDDSLYLPGATQTLDIWMKYNAFFPPIQMPTDPIKIFQGGNAVAYTLANRFSAPRMGDVGGHFTAERDEEIRQIVQRFTHKNLRKDSRRGPYGGGHASGYNGGHGWF